MNYTEEYKKKDEISKSKIKEAINICEYKKKMYNLWSNISFLTSLGTGIFCAVSIDNTINVDESLVIPGIISGVCSVGSFVIGIILVGESIYYDVKIDELRQKMQSKNKKVDFDLAFETNSLLFRIKYNF